MFETTVLLFKLSSNRIRPKININRYSYKTKIVKEIIFNFVLTITLEVCVF